MCIPQCIHRGKSTQATAVNNVVRSCSVTYHNRVRVWLGLRLRLRLGLWSGFGLEFKSIDIYRSGSFDDSETEVLR